MTAEELVRHNERYCTIFNALRGIFFGTAIMTTYYLAHNLSQTEIFVLQTILNVGNVSFDAPFGYLADRMGTRRVMLIGSGIMLAQSIHFAFCQTFWQFVPSLVATGLYIAALGSTANGLMTKSLMLLEDETKAQEQYQAYLIISTRVTNIAFASGSLAGGMMAWLGGIQMPYILQPIVPIAALITAWKLIDPHQKMHTQHADFQMLIKVLRVMLVDRKPIRYMILMYSGFRLYYVLCFWILQPCMVRAGVPRSTFGVVYFAWALLITYLAGELKHMKAESATWLWVRIVIVCSLGAYLAGATTSIFGFAALMFGMTLVMTFVERLFNEFMHGALPEDGVMRNTELSIGSTIPSLVYAVTAPFFGMLVDGTSVGTSLVVIACVCLAVTGTSLVMFRRSVVRQ